MKLMKAVGKQLVTAFHNEIKRSDTWWVTLASLLLTALTSVVFVLVWAELMELLLSKCLSEVYL